MAGKMIVFLPPPRQKFLVTRMFGAFITYHELNLKDKNYTIKVNYIQLAS